MQFLGLFEFVTQVTVAWEILVSKVAAQSTPSRVVISHL